MDNNSPQDSQNSNSQDNSNSQNKDSQKKYLSAKEQGELLKKALGSLDEQMDAFKNIRDSDHEQ